MTKAKAVVLVAFVLAFGAGVAVGMAVRRPEPPKPHGSWLARELNLTPEQVKQMEQIWSSGEPGSSQQTRRAIAEWRDQAVLALLTEEQRARYEEIMRQYQQKLADLEAERRRSFEEKVARTRAILTEEQRRKHDELMQKRFGPPGGPPTMGPLERTPGRPGGGFSPRRRGHPEGTDAPPAGAQTQASQQQSE